MHGCICNSYGALVHLNKCKIKEKQNNYLQRPIKSISSIDELQDLVAYVCVVVVCVFEPK